MPDAEAVRAEATWRSFWPAVIPAVAWWSGRVSGLPAGVGEPVFEKLDANLAKAILSIGGGEGI